MGWQKSGILEKTLPSFMSGCPAIYFSCFFTAELAGLSDSNIGMFFDPLCEGQLKKIKN